MLLLLLTDMLMCSALFDGGELIAGRIPVLRTASYTSTIAEELAQLLRSLRASHAGWRMCIDEYIVEAIDLVPGLLLLDHPLNTKPLSVSVSITSS